MAEDLFADAARVLFVHAHPDDETLATGGLIAHLTSRGVEVAVLTATRGEQGEVPPGPLAALQGTPELAVHREGELTRACAALGVTARAFLGTPPARAAGLNQRRYTDSGMRWLDDAETVAGPGDSATPDALSLAAPGEIAADIAAYATHLGATTIVSYDAHGGYGHPDHVALHAPSRTAASVLGVPFLEVASVTDSPGQRIATPELLDQIKDALSSYASQLAVEGDEVVHVGGQRQPIQTEFTVRSAG
ncbi:MAG: PIG-L family deacetylase [Propioniciclava sp.]|uniref:PIG-L family deacetylase n=1 Tax=Propioniciclava sp. TaxID=2038686 RepID=UPI0039E52907